MDNARTSSTGLLALRVTTASIALGAIYFAYMSLAAFKPDILRLVPVIWLIAGFTGFMLGIQATLVNAGRRLGLLSVAISVINIPLAAVFMIAAAMADRL